MPPFVDITGQVFGRLTAIKRVPERKHRYAIWKCVCSCGNITYGDVGHLRNGGKKSCGCLTKEGLNYKHGLARAKNKHPLLNIWYGMRHRCYNKNNPSYVNYGGRGIRMCRSWHNFMNFVEWAEKNPRLPGTSIDRKNNNGNYTPRNCKWSTPKEQANNRRKPRRTRWTKR